MKYRDKLVQQIKDAGQELIRRAETMVAPGEDLITGMSITIDFTQGADARAPEITYTKSVLNKTQVDRMFPKDREPSYRAQGK